MSKVYLQPYYSNRSTDNPHQLELSEEMLLWPMRLSNDIKDEFSIDDQKKYEETYNKMLRALIKLVSFDSVVSLQIDPIKQIIYPSYWCEMWILFEDKIVLKFDQCPDDDKSFHTIFDWPKTDNFKEIEQWTSDQWKLFFLDQIEEKAANDLQESANKVAEANRVFNQQKKATQEIASAIELARGSTRAQVK